MSTATPQLQPLDPRQRYSINEALAYLRTSRQSFYELVAAGRLSTIVEGRRRYVPGAEIARLSQVAR